MTGWNASLANWNMSFVTSWTVDINGGQRGTVSSLTLTLTLALALALALALTLQLTVGFTCGLPLVRHFVMTRICSPPPLLRRWSPMSRSGQASTTGRSQ